MDEGRGRKYCDHPLFGTETAGEGRRRLYRLFASTIFAGIVGVLSYRVAHMPGPDGEYGRAGWIGMLGAELWFGFYWILTQFLRWSLVFRRPFPHSLLKRCVVHAR
ncbi:unnamed protein product [Cuscuta campestris]|uniref:Uncharacterized protein n=1 Tax=Cuscuta campestris TaxID=132261 RepID=A0A484KWU8_9ASTE|nr:unnamed protein product [Cuscuta campestris]